MLRTVALAGFVAVGLATCVSRGVNFVPFLPPTADASRDELVARVNDWASITSLVLRVDLQFETVEVKEEGRGRRYHTAKGRLLLQRPGLIRLNIEAPILSANVAEMASDGTRFQLLIYPPEYRAFIVGSNDRFYRDESAKLDRDPELAKAGPLVNIRPQHFNDAFLPKPIGPDSISVVNEERVLEPDRRPGAKKGAQVTKSYYVLTAIDPGRPSPRSQFWFDRIGEITLTRQRVFDRDGRLVTDIQYADYLPPAAASGKRLPGRVVIERPYDDYSLVVNVQPDGILVDRELPETAFVLSVPPEWGDTVRRIDLDARE